MNPAFNAIELSLLLAPLVAGLLVVATHIPLGQQVLSRGIIFIDLAIAQIAGIGVIAVELAGFDAHGPAGQIGAVTAALAGAGLLALSERHWPQIQEALIGTLFAVAACGGILLLAHNPHGGEQLRDMLTGQILWVTPSQLWPTALLSAIVLALWLATRGRNSGIAFYGVFALAVTASVQLVGVYLVFATLIMPALATRRLRRRRVAAGYATGTAGYLLGLLLSAALDLPAGAMIVLTMAGVAILVAASIGKLVAERPGTVASPQTAGQNATLTEVS